LGFVLSVFVTLWDKRSWERIPLWTGGLDAVSVVFTVGLRTLWLVW